MTRGQNSEPIILLVEGDPGVRDALRRLLDHEGLPVVATASLEEARAEIRARGAALQVALVDLELGQEEGLALAEELHRQAGGPHVVVFSAQGERIAPGRVIASGVKDVLSKPASPSAIVAAVRRALGGGGPGPAGEWERTHPSRGEHRAS